MGYLGIMLIMRYHDDGGRSHARFVLQMRNKFDHKTHKSILWSNIIQLLKYQVSNLIMELLLETE